MTIEELVEFGKRATKAIKAMDDWDIVDQMKLVSAHTEYIEKIEPIINKYDPNKPKKFIFKRLDES